MNIKNIIIFQFLILAAGFAFTISPALAHSFNVALILPPSNTSLDKGRQIREGFMLATAERDSHPDQESDGHLGGLDVYVRVIDEQGDINADIGRIVSQGDTDIVAAFVSENRLSLVKNLLQGKEGIALLLPGQSPFSKSDQPAVTAFISAYEREYGRRPTTQAAQGYNAARRIDRAVRAQGGVGDKKSLTRTFIESARNFNW